MFGSFFFSTCKKNIESTQTQAPSGRSDVEFVSTGRLRRPWSLCCIHWFRASQYAWPPAVFYKEHKRLGEIGGGKKTHEAHTCHLKRNHFKKTFHLNQPSIFSWYVSFQGMYIFITMLIEEKFKMIPRISASYIWIHCHSVGPNAQFQVNVNRRAISLGGLLLWGTHKKKTTLGLIFFRWFADFLPWYSSPLNHHFCKHTFYLFKHFRTIQNANSTLPGNSSVLGGSSQDL